jgi:hypothetical protein
LTLFSSGMDSFHFHVDGSTFRKIFLPNGRIRDLWGI